MQISDDVRSELRHAAISADGLSLKLTRKIARNLYVKINQALEALGGEWQRKAQAHVFKSDVRPALKALLESGHVLSDADYGFFETPMTLAADLVDYADVCPNQLALEPSAGCGRLVDALLEAGARVHAFERHNERRRHLDMRYGNSVSISLSDDFLSWPIRADYYDRVVMNPPFIKCGLGDHLDHVQHAYKMLKPGGVLVSVLPSSVRFREDKRHKAFRDWYEAHGEAKDLPAGSFRVSGTDVNTCAIRLIAR